MNLAYKAIRYENWPSINQIEIKKTARILQSSEDLKLDHTSKTFNRLPSTVRHEAALASFCRSPRKEPFMQAKAWFRRRNFHMPN